MDGWEGGRMDGEWMAGQKAVLRIAYCNQKVLPGSQLATLETDLASHLLWKIDETNGINVSHCHCSIFDFGRFTATHHKNTKWQNKMLALLHRTQRYRICKWHLNLWKI